MVVVGKVSEVYFPVPRMVESKELSFSSSVSFSFSANSEIGTLSVMFLYSGVSPSSINIKSSHMFLPCIFVYSIINLAFNSDVANDLQDACISFNTAI